MPRCIWQAAFQPGPPTDSSHARHQRICTEPDTLTRTALLPASTGIGESDMAALASIAIMRGRTGPWSLVLMETSRSA